ncbi:hypothetical protein FC093_00820 [Ilyomonas limi]|uniref:Uncharacterized protein n=1 Tax=Ilyomonas limi TaxID=2575867 RepID=A0A4U3L8K1_9BACT|nr:hypothetical protein [Ilyomonas limi]TKK71598.1 hypothetical protein FC093_00820 [Ilyomonas limi]
MRAALHILLKIWVQQFYQRNAGFFLFLFVVLFGVVQNPLAYHYKLMQGIVTAYTTLVVALIVWLLYACKCSAIILKSIAREKTWLYQLQAMDAKRLFLLLTIIQVILFLPAAIYILVTISIGIHVQQYVAVIMLCLFLLLVHVLSAALYYYALFNNGIQFQLFKKPVFTYPFSKGFFSFLLWYNLYKSKLKTVAVKFFSFVLLFIPLVWNRAHIELSDFVIFFQISIATHAVIVYDSVQFLERDFPTLRNMPLPLYKLFMLFASTYIVLLLPEIFFLWYYGNAAHLGVSIFLLLLYYIGQLLLFTSLAYEKHQKIEHYLLYIGLITACSLLLTPLKSFGLIGCALIIIAFALFSGNYYQYEPEYEEH